MEKQNEQTVPEVAERWFDNRNTIVPPHGTDALTSLIDTAVQIADAVKQNREAKTLPVNPMNNGKID